MNAGPDLRALMRIRSLELRARVIVEGFWKGMHRSPLHGFSVEFTEYRPYTPGDDPRALDWRLYARTDRFYLKKYEDETNLRCTIVADQSKSMDFGTAGYTKAQYAATLAATLAYFLFGQGDAVGLIAFDEGVDAVVPARNRPGHLRHLMRILDRPGRGRATDLLAPLRRCAELLRRRGLVALVSDLLAPAQELASHLGYLRAAGHDVVLFEVEDPAERDLGPDAPAVFEDAESGLGLYVDPRAAREGYRRRREAHLAAVAASCRDLGIERHRVSTDRPLEGVLLDFLGGRMRRGARVRRRTRA